MMPAFFSDDDDGDDDTVGIPLGVGIYQNHRHHCHDRHFSWILLSFCHQQPLLPFPRRCIRRLQHRVQQAGRLLLAGVLRMAVGSFQKRRVRVTQQISGHLLTRAIFEQISGEEMPHRVQVVVLGETVAVIQAAQMAAEGVRVNRLPLVGKNQVIRANAIVFHNLVEKQLAQIVIYQLGQHHHAGAVTFGVALDDTLTHNSAAGMLD